jgi:hypothetical protein
MKGGDDDLLLAAFHGVAEPPQVERIEDALVHPCGGVGAGLLRPSVGARGHA